MARHLFKEWKKGDQGRSTMGPYYKVRIRWYEQEAGVNIRLELEDVERRISLLPDSKEEADNIWFLFKHAVNLENLNEPVITPLLALLKNTPAAKKEAQ